MATSKKKTVKKAAPKKTAIKKTAPKAKKKAAKVVLNPTPAQFRKIWTKALRSGEYKQTTGKLHDPVEGYCCLGVACDLYNKHFDEKLEVGEFAGSVQYNGETALPPYPVYEALGLENSSGSFSLPKSSSKPVIKKLIKTIKASDNIDAELNGVDLASLNDLLEYDFKQIAAVIDAAPTGLFPKGK